MAFDSTSAFLEDTEIKFQSDDDLKFPVRFDDYNFGRFWEASIDGSEFEMKSLHSS